MNHNSENLGRSVVGGTSGSYNAVTWLLDRNIDGGPRA